MEKKPARATKGQSKMVAYRTAKRTVRETRKQTTTASLV